MKQSLTLIFSLKYYTKSALSVLQGTLEIVRYNEKFDFNRQFRLSARKN